MNAQIRSMNLRLADPYGGQREVEANFELVVHRPLGDAVIPLSLKLRVAARDSMDTIARIALDELDAVLKQAAQ